VEGRGRRFLSLSYGNGNKKTGKKKGELHIFFLYTLAGKKKKRGRLRRHFTGVGAAEFTTRKKEISTNPAVKKGKGENPHFHGRREGPLKHWEGKH